MGSKKHGMLNTPTWRCWKGMRQRCNAPYATDYRLYGARGVRVCEEWDKSFAAFFQDMGLKPENKSLDRIDPDGNYEPSNCRWATPSQQNRNRRKRASTASKFMGVQKNFDGKSWQSRISIENRSVSLGTFGTEDEASAAYHGARKVVEHFEREVER